MNPNLCRVALRPRGPLEVFDLSLRLLRAHAAIFGRLTLLLVLPCAIFFGVGAALTDGHYAWLFGPIAVAPLLQAPFTLLGGRLLFTDSISVGQVLRELVARPLALLAVPFWLGLICTLGVLTCGVALLLLPMMVFVTEAALLERADGARIARRAVKLSSLHPGIAVAATFGWFVLTVWGALVGEGSGQLLVGTILQIGKPFGALAEGVVTPYLLMGALCAQPLFGVYRLLLFVDVRTRVDAWDLQVGLRAVGLEADQRMGPPEALVSAERSRAGGARP